MNTLLIVLSCLAAVLIVWAVLLVCFPYEVFKFIIMILRHTCFVERFDGEENVVTHKDGTSDVSEETKTCPNCGKSIPANSARCPNCGKKFE